MFELMKRYMPPQGTARGLSHYFPMIDDFVKQVGGGSPLFNRAVEIFRRGIDEGFGDQDAAAGCLRRARESTQAHLSSQVLVNRMEPEHQHANPGDHRIGTRRTAAVARYTASNPSTMLATVYPAARP